MRRGRPSVLEAERLQGRILEASWEVLLETSFDAFTIDRVARHARIGKATIYARFISKRDLLIALLHHGIACKRASLQVGLGEQTLDSALLNRAIVGLKHLFSADGQLLERLIDWLDTEAGSAQGGLRALVYQDALQLVEQVFREAIARGDILLDNPALTARFWLEGMLGHYKLTFTEGSQQRLSHEDWAKAYVSHFLAGLPKPANP